MSRAPGGDRDRWARLRFMIIGPLLAAPPEPGARQAALAALVARHWRHPVTGEALQFGLSTIERWYYAAKNARMDPVGALRRSVRKDAGAQRSIAPALTAALHAQYQVHPSWSAQLHYDNLGARVQGDATLRAAALRRERAPVSARVRVARLEVRSFESAHTNALWHADFHHGKHPVLTRSGQWRLPVLLGVIDDHSRLVCHLQWYLAETAETFVHGLSQALAKRALPRALMTDKGSPMLAAETVAGLHRLGIVHETTLPYSPYQNAKQESFWATLEARLMAMLEGCAELTLERLNELLRREELLTLGSRIRARLALEYVSRKELHACLEHLLTSACNRSLMTPELMRTP